MLPIIARAHEHADAIAVLDGDKQWTYTQLLSRSAALGSVFLGDESDLNEARVAFLLPAGADYVCVQWAIWRSGGVTVPLSPSATITELAYTLADADVSLVVTVEVLADRVRDLCHQDRRQLLVLDGLTCEAAAELAEISLARRAMILYTSGTTSKPKGVVTTHHNITAQIEALITAWHWQASDRIPLFLPLHHIHGIINVLSCGLWSGARVEVFERFDVERVLERVAANAYTVFMAVPTIYVKMIQALESKDQESREEIVRGFSSMRLMVSGSAALPANIHRQWTQLTNQALLERYGMTEIGMALSNPYDGERRPGAVGQPLPGVELRLRADSGAIVTSDDQPGEIQVRGPCVFQEYWQRPDATCDAFVDGWFQTGDIAVLEQGYYRIMGRSSVDIIKSGGYKLSALEIETVLLDHPDIRECAVVGVADDTWGEVVSVALVVETPITLESLRRWCKDRLSRYKTPSRVLLVDQLPRNAMGKITKPAVRKLFQT